MILKRGGGGGKNISLTTNIHPCHFLCGIYPQVTFTKPPQMKIVYFQLIFLIGQIVGTIVNQTYQSFEITYVVPLIFYL